MLKHSRTARMNVWIGTYYEMLKSYFVSQFLIALLNTLRYNKLMLRRKGHAHVCKIQPTLENAYRSEDEQEPAKDRSGDQHSRFSKNGKGSRCKHRCIK